MQALRTPKWLMSLPFTRRFERQVPPAQRPDLSPPSPSPSSSTISASSESASPYTLAYGERAPSPTTGVAPPTPLTCTSAVRLVQEKTVHARFLSDAQILRHGMPSSHLSRDVSLRVLGAYRLFLCHKEHFALAGCFAAAEQQRYSDLRHSADLYVDSLCEWLAAHKNGQDAAFHLQQVSAATAQHSARPLGDMLRMWCATLGQTLGEIVDYEQWRQREDDMPRGSIVPLHWPNATREIVLIMTRAKWQPALLQPAAERRLEALLPPVRPTLAEQYLVPEPRDTGLGLMLDGQPQAEPPLYSFC